MCNMVNMKHIFITTGISVLFGVYSIYNIFEYIRLIHNNRTKRILDLTEFLFNNINDKYENLQSKYEDMKNEFIKSQEDTKLLVSIIEKLQILQNKVGTSEEENFKSETVSIIDTNESIIDTNESIICDEICDLNDNIPRIHMETMTSNINNEFIELSNADYEAFHNMAISLNKDKNSINSELNKCSRSRSASLTEINWVGLTQKFLFG